VPLFWKEHRQRLLRSCELARFDTNWGDVDPPRIIAELLRRNALRQARIRVTISRGLGDPDQVDGFHHTWVVTARPFNPLPESRYEEGVRAVLVGITRNATGAIDPEIKSGNLLNSLLARREALLRGAAEGIMLNQRGMLAEGALANLFWLCGGILETPSPSSGILRGVTRGKVLALARAATGHGEGGEDLPGQPIPRLREVREVDSPPERLREAEEVFLTGTSIEVLPVTSWEDRTVGSGRGGPVARELRARLRRLYPPRA
jgi:branched-chain amino acid aminotransferase